MCGRYTAAFDKRELESYLGLSADHLDFRPRYNVAPTQSVPVVTELEGRRTLSLMRWGMRPHWSKSELINARSETITEKPSFRRILSQRCIVLADGYFEWKGAEHGKVPYHVTLPGIGLFAFAGLWSSGHNGESAFVIITTDAAPALQDLHARMPVVFPVTAWHDVWLRAPLPEALALLTPYAGEVRITRVSARVNSPRNDDAQLLTPDNTLC